MNWLLIVDFHFVNTDARVGTYCGATCASDAGVGVFHVGKMIATIIHFFFLQREHMSGAGHSAQVATFAALNINYYCTFDFCH